MSAIFLVVGRFGSCPAGACDRSRQVGHGTAVRHSHRQPRLLQAPGRGPGSSGLRFDLTLPVEVKTAGPTSHQPKRTIESADVVAAAVAAPHESADQHPAAKNLPTVAAKEEAMPDSPADTPGVAATPSQTPEFRSS
jgi:hypothetical protein